MQGRTGTDDLQRDQGSGETGGFADGFTASSTSDAKPSSSTSSAKPAANDTADRQSRADALSAAPGPLYSSRDWERAHPEDAGEVWRKASHRDYARVIHSPSWRRLQGKTQLFPGHESDFFRNRLTHSLEVAQVAEAIALKLNAEHPYFQQHNLDERICATAGLMHDLGHPPFGHNGEHALDDRMREYGGFEGNAQTLRIISRLEKKMPAACEPSADGSDCRVGLNLAARAVAAALKYDRPIPHVRSDGEAMVKGYYADDEAAVERVKDLVAPGWRKRSSFKTIECSIMDLADDIAYSAYDLEDSLKAGFVTPASILSANDELLGRVAKKVSKALKRDVEVPEIVNVFLGIFSGIMESTETDSDNSSEQDNILRLVRGFQGSKNLAERGELRTALTSQLVNEAVKAVQVSVDEEFPMLSSVRLSDDAFLKVETLKNYNFEATIFSTRLKVAEFRGYGIVTAIFDALSGPKGYLLMPDDVRSLYTQFEANATARMRVVCDFIAGMTDRYAVEFYGRLHSDGHTIFKPI